MRRTVNLFLTLVIVASIGQAAESISLPAGARASADGANGRAGAARAAIGQPPAPSPDPAPAPASAAGPARAAAIDQAQTAGSQTNAAKRANPAGEKPAASNSSAGETTSTHNPAVQNISQEPVTEGGQLPQTSTILPLLGLIGLGSLVAGFFARR